MILGAEGIGVNGKQQSAPTASRIDGFTIGRNNNQNIRNVNVGMFSGPRTSYQRYNLSQNAFGALYRTGA